MKKIIWVLIVVSLLLIGFETQAMFDESDCQDLQSKLHDTYSQIRDITTDFQPSTYNDLLKSVESTAIKSWNQSDMNYSNIDSIANDISTQVYDLPISDLDKQFYKVYISHQLQYHMRSQNCLPANTYKAYKKLYDKIVSNLKKYWRNDLSNPQKVTKLDMINDKLDLIDKYSWYKYGQIISYLHIEINRYITYILRLQS